MARPAGPDRLDFTLPEFTRYKWVSDHARDVWSPRIGRITAAWSKIEWLSVSAGIRPSGLFILAPEQFAALARLWTANGLTALPLATEPAPRQPYTNGVPAERSGGPRVWRVAVGARSTVLDLQAAWDAGDDRGIGALLGYPPCCREFFSETWVEGGYIDTTWLMAANTKRAEGNAVSIETARPQANILGRWLGVRAVPHLPCSFACEATVELAGSLLKLGRDEAWNEEIGWLEDILSWPVEWSALHGIAEIKFPVLTVSTRTDATPCKYTVRLEGSRYPSEGASGLRFPYRRPPRLQVSDSASFKRGLSNPIVRARRRPDWYHADNGFSSQQAMQRLHQPIVTLACSELTGSPGDILDLGCGNGALLRKICRRCEGLVPHGVDCNPEAIDHARRLLPAFADNFRHGDLFTTELPLANERQFVLVIMTIGRLAEVSPDEAHRCIDRLAARTERLLLYRYPGPHAERFESSVMRYALEIVRRGQGEAAIVRPARR